MKSKYNLLNELIELMIEKCDEAIEEAFDELLDIYEDPDNIHLFNEMAKNEMLKTKNWPDYSYLEYCIDLYKEDHQDD